MMNRSIKNSAVKNSNSTNLTRLNRLELENKKIKQKNSIKLKSRNGTLPIRNFCPILTAMMKMIRGRSIGLGRNFMMLMMISL